MAEFPIKIPISGGPHAGKTTLLEALHSEYPDAWFVPEPATHVIGRELEREACEPGYVPSVPWIEYSAFGPLVTQASIDLEAAIPEGRQVVFQDRSLIDTIAYCRVEGFERFIPEVERRIRAAKYAFALFCEPVGIYAASDVRREDVDKARWTHDLLAQAYEESGIPVVHLRAFEGEKSTAIVNRVGLVRMAVQNWLEVERP